MALKFEDLRVLQAAEAVADSIWQQVVRWEPFVRETVGKQLARAADSIGANIAETFGRFHYGEKLQFLYYARGSLFEAKYWLNRASARELMPTDHVGDYASHLSDLARQLNAFASSLKAQRREGQSQSQPVSEAPIEYAIDQSKGGSEPLFSEDELQWLQTLPDTKYLITNI